MVERVTERDDGITTERVTEHDTGGTVVVERSGGSGAGLLIGLAVLILAVVAAVFLINQNRQEAVKTDAITEAARSVEQGAEKVGEAAEKAGDAVVAE